jgi:hypothetical protein
VTGQRVRTAGLAAFHFALCLLAFAAIYRALVVFEGDVSWLAVALPSLYLAAVVWWATGRALAKPLRSRLDDVLTRGVRWGATAGIVFWLGLMLIWIAVGGLYVMFFQPANIEYNLLGGRYAFVMLPLLAVVPGGLVAASTGAALGGSIAIIDRAVFAVAHWTLRLPRGR